MIIRILGRLSFCLVVKVIGVFLNAYKTQPTLKLCLKKCLFTWPINSAWWLNNRLGLGVFVRLGPSPIPRGKGLVWAKAGH